MNKMEINSLQARCDKCQRKGFAWARGTCQYCGHVQYDDATFGEGRKLRNSLNEKACDELKKVRQAPDRQYVGPFADVGGFGDFGGDCSGE